ncbi:MAG: response regulator [Holophagaceae bacterium]|uniref:Response regulator n=1 Tax=Candidatus Geothrix skivensis TaxID=2954439 RepID=A0A9D7SFV3_9BACT|nr:response regulator [Candidatus Geothrix skivensis]
MSEAQPRILCIEDNPMNWRLVQRLLSQAGYEMHWAEDGLKGCELALALKPSLILLDINLPGLSGFEVATKLRQNRSMDGTLIVALTAKTMRSDRETALVTGCDGFISKPIDPFLFVGQVEAYLGGRRDHLEQGREGAALRQFSQQVVEHLEAQLREAQEGNRKLLEVQSELEQRSHHLTRLLSLSKDIIPVQDDGEILSRVLGQLHEELGLDRLRAYRLHASGAYFQGLSLTPGGAEETPVLAAAHPLIKWAETLPVGSVLTGMDLRQSAPWEQGIELGLWNPKAQALLLPLRSRSEEARLWGLLAADRLEQPFQPFEIELAALHAGILQVSLENAGLIAHLAETSRALGTSYEGLESAYEALKEAQRALGAQNQKTTLGGLFMSMAQRIQVPVGILKEESTALSIIMDRPDLPAPEERAECHRSMEQIHRAISQVDGLVGALLRRAGKGVASSPEWIHLHDFLGQELDLLRAEGILPENLPVERSFQSPRDLLFGVYSDFSEVFGHLIRHALDGRPCGIKVRTSGDENLLRIEVEDDGGFIEPNLLDSAFEPFPDLRPAAPGGGRRPGQGLAACAQLLNTYRGSIQILPRERGSLVRVDLPME